MRNNEDCTANKPCDRFHLRSRCLRRRRRRPVRSGGCCYCCCCCICGQKGTVHDNDDLIVDVAAAVAVAGVAVYCQHVDDTVDGGEESCVLGRRGGDVFQSR